VAGGMTIEQRRAVAIASTRLRTQQKKPEAAPPAEISDAEDLAGAPATRFAMGAASPFLGLAQLAANATGVGDEWINSTLKETETLKRRGMTPAADLKRLREGRAVLERLPGYESQIADVDRQIADLEAGGASADPKDASMDVAGVAGTVMSPAALKVMKLAPAASALGRIGQGTAVGAGFGASAPVTDGENYKGSKSAQIVTGALLGGLIPAGMEAGKAVAGGIRNVIDLFTDKGAGRILTNYQNRIIGDKGRDEVIAALKASREPVPGYKPTAAEAVANVPAGSPIIAHQKLTAGTPGGPSGEFGQRALDQKAALEAAAEARNAATGPMREAALAGANKTPQFPLSIGEAAKRFRLTGEGGTVYGVKASDVTHGLKSTLGKPGIRASDVVSKTAAKLQEKIASLTDDGGRIDARDLYTVRKEIGNTIKSYAKETSNWDKKLAAGIERDVQRAMDDAIEAAGGAGWKDYLREFTERSAGMESAKAAVKAAAKPAQRTNLGGGVNVAEESRVHLPQMLSRPMMIANAVMKRIGSGVEPRLDAEAARRYLNPQELAKALETMPPQQQSVISALLQRMGIIGSATTIADQEQF
jgi:hypothetical protein